MKRKLYLFTNYKGDGNSGWEDCYSMADDGHVLGEHVCSNIGFMYTDLVRGKDRTETIEKHFGCPLSEIDIIQLKAGDAPPPEVYEKNQKLRELAETHKEKER